MKRVIVTGGAGFIGSHVVDLLVSQGAVVGVLDDFSTGSLDNLADAQRKGVTVIAGDIATAAARAGVKSFSPEVMLMLAAQPSVKVSMRDPVLDAQSNLVGLVNLLEAARQSSCKKVVFATSGGTIYGDVSRERLPVCESEPLRARSFYGLTKLTAVAYLDLYREFFGIEYAALALGNVYGPRQSPDGEAGVIAIFGKRILNQQVCTINGDGKTTRDYVYVTDVAEAFVAAMDRGAGLFNIGTGRETSVLEIYEELARAARTDSSPTFGPALAGEVRRVALNAQRAHRELGWSTKVSLSEGIDKVLSWMRANHQSPMQAES